MDSSGTVQVPETGLKRCQSGLAVQSNPTLLSHSLHVLSLPGITGPQTPS